MAVEYFLIKKKQNNGLSQLLHKVTKKHKMQSIIYNIHIQLLNSANTNLLK